MPQYTKVRCVSQALYMPIGVEKVIEELGVRKQPPTEYAVSGQVVDNCLAGCHATLGLAQQLLRVPTILRYRAGSGR